MDEGTVSRLNAFLSVSVLLGTFGCSPDPSQHGEAASAENRPPSVRSITLVPNPIVRQGVVTAVVEGEDPNHDEVHFRFQWFVNGNLVSGESSSTFDAKRVTRGDRVSVDVIPNDGKVDGPTLRAAEVTVGNTPPVIKDLILEPKVPKAGDRITVAVEGNDADGDEVHYRYTWWHNNKVVLEGEQSSLDTTGFSRDDIVSVVVVPRDRDAVGKEARAQSAAFSNHPPKFISSAPTSVSNGLFDYQIIASDRENDPLIFSLETAPPGMTIDDRTGHLRWTVPSSPNGAYRVKVIVRDDHEGWAFQEFEIAVKST